MTDQTMDAIINFAKNTNYVDLTIETVESAKIFITDSIAVGISGSKVESAAAIRSTVSSWGTGDDSSILGVSGKLPTNSAAYVNSFQIHCQEYDCLHEGATVHAMAVLTGALLALAQTSNYSGRDLILGTAIGVDVAANLGLSATKGLSFFRPATAGALGACAALARLEHFNDLQMRDALGLTYSQLAGTMQAHVEGSVALPIQIAGAARAVITSIQLVKQKLSGPHEIMDGPFGYFTLFEPHGEPKKIFSHLGLVWRVTELSHKPFPTGRAAHAILDGINTLQNQHLIQSSNIKTVTAQVPSLVKRLVDRPARENMTVNYARLCLQYLVAVQLTRGVIDTGSFSNDLLNDSEILAFAKKVQIIQDDNPNPNSLSPQKLFIESYDGSNWQLEIPHTLGSPQNPLTNIQCDSKFMHCCESGNLSRHKTLELLETLKSLENCVDVNKLMQMTS